MLETLILKEAWISLHEEKTESPHGSCLTSNPSCRKISNRFFLSSRTGWQLCVFNITQTPVQTLPQAETFARPTFCKSGSTEWHASSYCRTLHFYNSGNVFTSSLILPITTEYQGTILLISSFYSKFSLVILRNRPYLKELAVRVETVARLKTSQYLQTEFTSGLEIIQFVRKYQNLKETLNWRSANYRVTKYHHYWARSTLLLT